MQEECPQRLACVPASSQSAGAQHVKSHAYMSLIVIGMPNAERPAPRRGACRQSGVAQRQQPTHHRRRHPMHALMSARPASFDDPTPINDTDGTYLRQAIVWSCTARARGNRPFGAVVVGAGGELLAEAYCNTTETGDCTGHAETNAVRQLSPRVGRDALAKATLYSSAEPCVMCAGAIFWSGIGRVVFGIDAVRLRVYRGERAEQRDAELSCRDVFAASPHSIECIGPALIEEASVPHIGFWKA